MEKLIVIRTVPELKVLTDLLGTEEYWSFDTETSGVTKDAEIIGFSVAASSEVGYYVIMQEWDVTTKVLVTVIDPREVVNFFKVLKIRKLVMHNGPFDCRMVYNNFGIQLIDSLHTDTMILAHLVDENRQVGLKELGVSIYGKDASKEQHEMKESVSRNGGELTKANYELYKADSELLARYGAKDAILTINLFYHLMEDLYAQGLDKFFYEDESMPLLKGPTYQLNDTGLKVDHEKLQDLKKVLEVECMEAKAYIHAEIFEYVKHKYPGTGKTNVFNIGASKQLAWLLFIQLGNPFNTLTKGGRDACKALGLKLPYTLAAKREFIEQVTASKDRVYAEPVINKKTGKLGKPKKFQDPWQYMACGKESLGQLATKYKWVARLLEYSKNLKLLNTYVEGIQSRMRYNVIHPSFLQHGTTSGRYSSKQPNFQNLPRDDKRIKSCIIARPGKVFVGADYSQLEPRVFASFSKDERLLASFKSGDDFYSVIGAEVFEKYDCSLKKDDASSFAKLHPTLRNISKVVALSSTYGTTAPKMAPTIGKSINDAQDIIDNYFEKFPSVKALMLESHEMAKTDGKVYNLFGRPRRIPLAMNIPKKTRHAELPYEARNILNLAINHRIQSTGASIMNRAAIAVYKYCKDLEAEDKAWADVKLVLQVHDELILEGPEHLANEMVIVLKHAMETTTTLPGVDLIAEPKVAYNLADLK